MKAVVGMLFAVVLLGCDKREHADPESSLNVIAVQKEAATPHEAPDGAPCPEPMPETSESPVEAENDRVCKSMYGVTCSALTHLLGPINAGLRKETRACVQERVAIYVSGEWVVDNKYQDPTTGDRYGDICIAVSM